MHLHSALGMRISDQNAIISCLIAVPPPGAIKEMTKILNPTGGEMTDRIQILVRLAGKTDAAVTVQ